MYALVSIQYQSVTDRQTDRHTDRFAITISRSACICMLTRDRKTSIIRLADGEEVLIQIRSVTDGCTDNISQRETRFAIAMNS